MNMDKYKVVNKDELNVQVMELVEKKTMDKETREIIPTGVFEYKVISFHPNLEKAYNWIVDKEINMSNFEDLKEVVNLIKELKSFIAIETRGTNNV